MVTFNIEPTLVIQLLVAFVLPVLVALVSRKVASPDAKAWMLALLTLVTSLLVEAGRAIAQDTTFDVGIALFMALPSFVVSVSSHYGLWKPTGVSDKALASGRK